MSETSEANRISKARCSKAFNANLPDDTTAHVASMAREEVIHRKYWEECVKLLQDHETKVSSALRARNERRVGWWSKLKEWATGEQEDADRRADLQLAAITQKLQKRVRQSEVAWQHTQRALADAEVAASRAQLQEEQVVRNGASFEEAAMAGLYYLMRIADKVPAPGVLSN